MRRFFALTGKRVPPSLCFCVQRLKLFYTNFHVLELLLFNLSFLIVIIYIIIYYEEVVLKIFRLIRVLFRQGKRCVKCFTATNPFVEKVRGHGCGENGSDDGHDVVVKFQRNVCTAELLSRM